MTRLAPTLAALLALAACDTDAPGLASSGTSGDLDPAETSETGEDAPECEDDCAEGEATGEDSTGSPDLPTNTSGNTSTGPWEPPVCDSTGFAMCLADAQQGEPSSEECGPLDGNTCGVQRCHLDVIATVHSSRAEAFAACLDSFPHCEDEIAPEDLPEWHACTAECAADAFENCGGLPGEFCGCWAPYHSCVETC